LTIKQIHAIFLS